MTDGEPETQGEQQAGIADRVRLGIPLALAAIAAVFVALGIEGEVRSRIIRNAPILVSAAFALAMVGLSLPLLDLATERRRRRLIGTLGGVILLCGAVLAVFIGTKGLSERETPTLSIVPVLLDTVAGVSRVEATATAPTLRSDEKLLLRVAVVRSEAVDELEFFCESSELVTLDWPPKDFKEKSPSTMEPVRVLYWAETGPSINGDASQTVALQVPQGEFSHACAFASLFTKPGDDHRRAWAGVDLRSAVPSE